MFSLLDISNTIDSYSTSWDGAAIPFLPLSIIVTFASLLAT